MSFQICFGGPLGNPGVSYISFPWPRVFRYTLSILFLVVLKHFGHPCGLGNLWVIGVRSGVFLCIASDIDLFSSGLVNPDTCVSLFLGLLGVPVAHWAVPGTPPGMAGSDPWRPWAALKRPEHPKCRWDCQYSIKGLAERSRGR